MSNIYITIASCSAESGESWEPSNIFAGDTFEAAQKAARDHIADEENDGSYDTYTIQKWEDGEFAGEIRFISVYDEEEN